LRPKPQDTLSWVLAPSHAHCAPESLSKSLPSGQPSDDIAGSRPAAMGRGEGLDQLAPTGWRRSVLNVTPANLRALSYGAL
jgi:hypothetical protein